MVSTVDKDVKVNGHCQSEDGRRCGDNIAGDHGTNGENSIDTKKLSFYLEHNIAEASQADNKPEILSRNEWFSIFHDKVRNKRKSIGMKNIDEDSKKSHLHLKVDDAIYSMFKDENGFVKASDFLTALTSTGIRKYDSRLKDTMTKLKIFQTANGADFDSPDALMLNEAQFKEVIGANIVFIDTILRNRFVIPEFKSFCDELEAIYQICKSMADGSLCEYIPQLSKCSEDLWAVSVCTVDGQRFSTGDTNARFTLQSGFAPFNYAIALNEKGSHVVHQYVGQEPSGRHYNDIVLDSRKKPHNPMINSGAMAICSILKEQVKMADRFDQLFSIYKKMAGGDYVGFSNTTYLSERATADRNFALAHYLRENKCLGGVKLNEMLELYFQLCSIEITSDSGSVFAATLANGGVCPLSGEKLFDANCTRDVLSLMYSCGMNNYSGQFSFNIFRWVGHENEVSFFLRIFIKDLRGNRLSGMKMLVMTLALLYRRKMVGLPAKSGVSGVIMVVVPDVMGICLYSPLLDEHANSVRGVHFCTELVRRFSFHNYDNLKHTFRKTNPTKRHDESKAEQIVNLLFSAATGDVSAMRRYWMEGLDMSLGDYDGRTALHLAAAEGWKSCVNFLLNKCRVNHVPRDRWGRTPMDDALRCGHIEIVEILQDWDTRSKSFDEESDNNEENLTKKVSELFRSCSVENENNYEDSRATWIKRNMGSLTSLNSF